MKEAPERSQKGGGGYLLHVAKHTKSHLATNYFPFWGEARKKTVRFWGQLWVYQVCSEFARIGSFGLLCCPITGPRIPNSQFPFPFRSPSPTSRDVVDVNKLSERLTSI